MRTRAWAPSHPTCRYAGRARLQPITPDDGKGRTPCKCFSLGGDPGSMHPSAGVTDHGGPTKSHADEHAC
eukprot:93565-Chlamydomonas_euryale.AAC.1